MPIMALSRRYMKDKIIKIQPKKQKEDWEEELWSFLKERHEQLKGYIDSPFLEKPKAIPNTCPTCLVTPKSIVEDCIAFFRSQCEQARREGVEMAIVEFLPDMGFLLRVIVTMKKLAQKIC